MFELFVRKGLLALFRAICFQRTTALVYCYRFANNCCPCLPLYVCKGVRTSLPAICSQRTAVLAYLFQLQRTAVLILFTTNCGPCLLLFILLFIHKRQRSFVFCYSFTKTTGPCLPVSFAKDCCPYFPFCLQKDRGPCLVLFILQRTLSLS